MIAVFAPAMPADHPRLSERIAVPLSERGHDVTIIACAPLGGQRPSNLKIVEMPGRERLGRISGVLRASRHLLRSPDVSVVICGGIEAWFVAVLLKPMRKWKVAFDSSEDYPAAIRSWSSGRLGQEFLAGIVRTVLVILSYATDVVVLSRRTNRTQFPGAGTTLFLANHVPGTRYLLPAHSVPAFRLVDEPLRIVSAGLFSVERGANVLDKALQLLDHQLPENSIELDFVGRFVTLEADEYLATLARHPVIARVSHVPWEPYESLMLSRLSTNHLGLALFQPVNDNNRNPMPNKVFDYMARGVVPIAPVWANELSETVLATHAYMVDTSSPEAIADAIFTAFSEESDRVARARAGIRLSWTLASTDFVSELESVVGLSPDPI